MFGHRKVPVLRLERVEKFACDHYKNIMDYGAHPKRQYAICFQHDPPQFAVLAWSDPYARTMNRIIGSFPAVFAAVVTVISLIILIVDVLPALNLIVR